MDRNRLLAWYLLCHKGQTSTALTRYEKKNMESPLSFCRLHVKILSAIQVYQFYELRHRVMNNSVHRPLNFQT